MKHSILLALTMSLLCSCHTPLYKAAEQGNVELVKQEIANGAVLDKGKHSSSRLLESIAFTIAMPIDIAQIGLTIGTLGGYRIFLNSLGIENNLLMNKIGHCVKKVA